ncbi:LacI family DNA-binding transcriptional regulator [Consotaella salsifontis]|uniref:Transcriptional regulator, LacI family n=1 Tax=Consotaella salsifontis TaxID=1365950 RepID=A0A1T4SJJ6_9HYPH|nr:substrate-binding domain-containing protein [Consotaella salsifontis]SKA28343.1 transcriptional regulator, LacI family [Consotaella salsifontis]
MKGIRQLADHLQISIGTVSRALNGKADVNPETRRRVLEAAEALGYVPNQSGRALRQGTTNTVGLIMTQGVNLGANNDNFFPGVIDGLQAVLARHGLDLVVLLCSSGEDPDAYLRRMVARRIVDALVVTATRTIDPRLDFLQKAGVPFVSLGRSQSGAGSPWIDLDFRGIALHSVERLVANGHRRIAVAAPTNDVHLGSIFMQGYTEALEAHGLPYDPEIVFLAETSEEGGYDVADRILHLENRPTAILLIAELMSVGLYRRLGEAGLRPGPDLAVIAERESPVGRFLLPRLTCFRVRLKELGVQLGETLLSTIPAFSPLYPDAPRRKIWPLELVEGESDPPISV